MLTAFQAIILGLLQGVSELFPVSSLGHSVLLPALLGWRINESADAFLVFVVATHFATALVLLFFFRRDWLLILRGLFRSAKNRRIEADDAAAKLGWLIVIATIPAGILGLLFEKKFELLFSSGVLIALFLAANGILLFAAEMLRKKSPAIAEADPDGRIAKLSFGSSLKIGLAECLALLPGFSRTGATLGAGLLAGLDHESAARFAFLLATPVIFAASALKLPALASADAPALGITLLGAAFAALGAYLSVKFLTRYFKKKTLLPFAAYCFAAGILAFIVLALRP